MKKILIMTIVATVAALLMPLSVLGNTEYEVPQTQGSEDLELQYDASHRVTVLIEGAVQEMDLDRYLVGVLAAEMPASFPVEALKAQAVAARTYALYKESLYGKNGEDAPESHQGAVLCADSGHCKAYCDVRQRGEDLWGANQTFYTNKITAAVHDTDGLIMVHEGKPIAAVFHAASAEKTEAAVDVWGSEVPYLVSVSSPGGEASNAYHATVELMQSDFAAAFQAAHPQADFSGAADTWFSQIRRSEAGGVISLSVGGVVVEGREIRSLAGLNSTNFTISVQESVLVFTTVGYGHGVGMSQYGARALALEGKTFDEILKHYYTGVALLLKSSSTE